MCVALDAIQHIVRRRGSVSMDNTSPFPARGKSKMKPKHLEYGRLEPLREKLGRKSTASQSRHFFPFLTRVEDLCWRQEPEDKTQMFWLHFGKLSCCPSLDTLHAQYFQGIGQQNPEQSSIKTDPVKLRLILFIYISRDMYACKRHNKSVSAESNATKRPSALKSELRRKEGGKT